MLNNKIYDVLKWMAITALPLIGTFLGNVLPVWGCNLSLVTRITTTISECGVLLAGLLVVSNYVYKKSGDAKADAEDME